MGNFKQQEVLKTYGKLPDYEEFQGYVMRIESELSQMGGKIYANSHNPPRGAMMRQLPQVRTQKKKLLRHLEILVANDKKDDFKQGGCLGGREKYQWEIRLMDW